MLYINNKEAAVTQTSRKWMYAREMAGALALYALVLVLALKGGRRIPPGPVQTAVYASPMLPFLLAVWAVVRHIRRSDEFMRKTVVEHLAITAAVTAGWTFTYGFIENAGYPHLSMFTVWPAMGAVWAVLGVVEHIRNR
jgi:hypothetical protein